MNTTVCGESRDNRKLATLDAGMAHAREQAAVHLDDRADNLDRLWCSSIAADILRDQAAEIGSGS